MESGRAAEEKTGLKGFLIGRFLGVMLGIFVSEQLISIFYDAVMLPGVSLILDSQQISVTADGKPILLLLQMLLYLLSSFLPGAARDYVQIFIGRWMEGALRISVDSPLYADRWGALLRVGIILLFLALLLVVALPYLAGALYYDRVVTRKVNQLMEAEKKRQLAYDRQRNLLLSDIAHDIKTPITTLCSYSKALADDMAQGEKKREYLDAIYAKSMQMSELITLLFEYVKMDSSGFELHREEGDLGELLRECAAALYADFEERKIALIVEIPEEAVPFCMDKVQMARAVTNLLTNAVRYGKEGGRALIRLDDYTIIVADDGTEIDREFAPYIFEPFSRADKARSAAGGSGLGLSIAAKIVQMHGGELKLDCGYGRGYTKAFRIEWKA